MTVEQRTSDGRLRPHRLLDPGAQEVEKVEPAYEGPTTEVVDVRDFFFHEAAVSQDRCRFFIHRVWMTLDEIEKLQKQGFFKNVSQLKDDPHKNREPPESPDDMRNRVKDMIEVLEHWDMEKLKVTWVAEQKVVLTGEAVPVLAQLAPVHDCLDAAAPVPDPQHLPGREARAPANRSVGYREPADRQHPSDEQLHHRRPLRRGRPRLASLTSPEPAGRSTTSRR